MIDMTLSAENEKLGSVMIADDVVAMIASLAATEIEGVSSMVGSITNEQMSKVSMKKLTKGVHVNISNGTAIVELAVVLLYGYNIPVICQKVQEKVKTAIENMTGLTVAGVNVKIVTVKMDNN